MEINYEVRKILVDSENSIIATKVYETTEVIMHARQTESFWGDHRMFTGELESMTIKRNEILFIFRSPQLILDFS